MFFSLFAKKNTGSHAEYSNRFRPSKRNAKTIESNIFSPGIPTHTKPNETKLIRYGRIGPRQQIPDNHEPRHRTLNYRDLHEGEQEKCGVILERTIGRKRNGPSLRGGGSGENCLRGFRDLNFTRTG